MHNAIHYNMHYKYYKNNAGGKSQALRSLAF